MKSMTSSELREAFLRFFESHDHQIVRSSPLVPGNDPTLLFTNAGMVQFKDVFLGDEKRDYQRATTSQRCVRAGGKHNDLENVGYTARHHTFFEMLGNFSFGDYFKEDAIRYAWEFVTEVLGIPAEKLWITVFEDDDEAAEIWKDKIGINPEQFSRLGAKDNFWAMGDTGPCGPCSEIFYDHGPDVPGGPPGSPDEDGDRYIEIWNLVFMQFDRSADGTMTPLPKPSVDTGMGLERVAAVMQGVHSNYEIDLFAELIGDIADILGIKDREQSSLRVIADHIRACSFLIVDGVLPGNEGRGYVLRRIIRRAVRHGYKLGVSNLFFHRLVAPLCKVMGDAYPELVEARAHVERVLEKEEHRFAETLSQGLGLLEESIAGMKGNQIPGDIAFKLYDTYGFPLDLTADIARERNLTIDQDGFDKAMGEQRERARAASSFSKIDNKSLNIDASSDFLGYERNADEASVIGLYVDGQAVESISGDTSGIVILDATPFYAESGGQVGDTGLIENESVSFRVADTQKSGKAHLHVGTLVRGALKLGQRVNASVDHERRDRTRRNHSATHLMHAALIQVLGDHVAQKGSLVTPERLRFDFSHYEGVTEDQLAEIENIVNEQIRANAAADTQVMDFDAAVESGATALFGEKYDDKVRVLKLGEFSVELCGGTHVARVGDIGFFKIVSESGVAAGIRRLEALTGQAAIDWVRAGDSLIADIGQRIKGSRENSLGKIEQIIARYRALEKELGVLKQKLATGSVGADPLEQAIAIGDLKLLVVRMDSIDANTLRSSVDRFKDKLGRGVVVIASVDDDKVRLAAGVSKDLTGEIRAGDLVRDLAAKVGGKGGGRPDFAQAGGTDIAALDGALDSVQLWVEERFNNKK